MTSLTLTQIPVSDIEPDPDTPRKKVCQQADNELSESIKENGLFQPIVVRKGDGGKFIIVFGTRRWQAACRLEWKDMDCIVTEADSKKALLMQVIENVQREGLAPEDLAAHLNVLVEKFEAEDQKATVRALAAAIGKSPGWVSEKLALARLPDEVRALKASSGVKNSRVLLSLARLNGQNPDAAKTIIKQIEEGKTVSVGLINEVRGKRKTPREPVEHKPELRLCDIPQELMQQPEQAKGEEEKKDKSQPSQPSKPAGGKRRVSEVAKILGVSENLPPEELLEIFADAYKKLVEEREKMAA